MALTLNSNEGNLLKFCFCCQCLWPFIRCSRWCNRNKLMKEWEYRSGGTSKAKRRQDMMKDKKERWRVRVLVYVFLCGLKRGMHTSNILMIVQCTPIYTFSLRFNAFMWIIFYTFINSFILFSFFYFIFPQSNRYHLHHRKSNITLY